MNVRLRLWPWHERFRNHFWEYRRLGMTRWDSLRAAWLLTWTILFLVLAPPAFSQAPSGPSTGTGYPAGAVAVQASTTGTTAATTATLAAGVGDTTYLCGFDIGSTATAAAAGNATVTGLSGGTLNFEMGTGTSPAVVHTTQNFNPCLPGAAQDATVAVVSAAPGAGGVISVTAWGYQKREP